MYRWKSALPTLTIVAGLIAMPQQKAPAGTENSFQGADDLSGAEMYRTYCAACHGIDGKGVGPAAAALKKTPADLTQIAKRQLVQQKAKVDEYLKANPNKRLRPPC